MSYVIRYRYPGTSNGLPVGLVYVKAAPNLGRGVFSYRREPEIATQYATREAAERVIAGKHWPEAVVLELASLAKEPAP